MMESSDESKRKYIWRKTNEVDKTELKEAVLLTMLSDSDFVVIHKDGLQFEIGRLGKVFIII